MEQLDHNLSTFIKETNKFETGFGIVRGKDARSREIDAGEPVEPQISRNDDVVQRTSRRILENIIIDKVATVPTARNRNIDTSSPMEHGIAAQDDGANS